MMPGKEAFNSMLDIVSGLKKKYPEDKSIELLSTEIENLKDNQTIAGKIEEDIKIYIQLILDNLPGMDVYIFDKELNFLFTAGREKERHSIRAGEFDGKSVHDFPDEHSREIIIPLFQNVIKGENVREELEYNMDVYQVIGIPVRNEFNEVVAGISFLQNITREKKEELSLRNAKFKAEESEKDKSMLLASMSHEIRTPLNTILGFSAQLDKIIINPKQKKYIRIINQSSEHLLNVVNELLIIFKLGFGKVYIDKVPFLIKNVFNEIYDVFKQESWDKGLDLEFVAEKETDIKISGDPYRLKQILLNLVGNAIKFTYEGLVHIYCTIEKEEETQVILKIQVSDTGMGIPAEELSNIFDEYKQAGNTEPKNRNGAGLGLSICKKLIELQGGTIEVESSPGKGSIFTIFIPYEKSEADSAVITEAARYKITDRQLENINILLADDDEHNRLLSETIFHEWGVKFEFAVSGTEALQKSLNKKYDVLLLDIRMPGIHGNDLVRKIRQDINNPNHNSHILTMTANVLKYDLNSYLRDGFDDFILKPYREDELYNKICSALKIPETRNVKNIDHIPDILDLTELKKTARGDKDFEQKMIESFIDSTNISLSRMRKGYENKNWKLTGEAAHKMTSSFRYFGIEPILKKLELIEHYCLYSETPELSLEVLAETTKSIDKMLQKLTTDT